MRSRARGIGRPALLLVLVCCVAELGCLPFAPDLTQISGTIFGDSINSREAGGADVAAIQGTVRCNGVAATSSTSGAYSLSVPAAKQYRCTASAPPSYTPVSATIAGSAGRTITLNFGPSHVGAACSADVNPADVACPALHLQPGTLSGRLTFSGGLTAAAHVGVTCWSPAAALRANAQAPQTYTATTDDGGSYAIAAIPVDAYACVAGSDQRLHTVSVAPATKSSLDFSICQGRSCPPVRFHGGPVMRTYTAYLIFWLPGSYTYEPQGSSSTFESLLAQYFSDVGGTSFYNILTQYWGYQGPIQNRANRGGTYVDTAPYVHCQAFTGGTCGPAAASRADPLYDDDIQAEVSRMMQKNGWSANANTEFFVFLGAGAEVCYSRAGGSDCSFAHPGTRSGFCGYHRSFAHQDGSDVIYATMPDVQTEPDLCLNGATDASVVSPNGDWTADIEINIASHEQFESVTDPHADNGAWFEMESHALEGGEIGDKCAWIFGAIQPDGSNITLNHGHRYLLQEEWSNQSNGCALSL